LKIGVANNRPDASGWKRQNMNANPEWGSIYKYLILNPIRGSGYFVQIPRVSPAVIHIESLQVGCKKFEFLKQ